MKRKPISYIVILGVIMLNLNLHAQQWVIELDNMRSKSINQSISVDGGGAMLSVGTSRLTDSNSVNIDVIGYILKVWSDGTSLSREVRIVGNQFFLCTVTELDDGNYMAFGYYGDSVVGTSEYYRNIRVLLLDDNLQTLYEKDYRVDTGGFEGIRMKGYHALRCAKAEDGNVILVTSPSYYVPNASGGKYMSRFRFYEFTPAGDTVRTVVQPEYIVNMEQEGSHTENIIPNPATGGFTFIAIGNYKIPSYSFYGNYGIWNLSRDMKITSKQPIVFGSYPLYYCPESMSCENHWYDDGLFLTYIHKIRSVDKPVHEGWLFMLDTLGGKHLHVQLPPIDSVTLSLPSGCSTAYVDDSTIFAVTYSEVKYLSNTPWQANITLINKDLHILGRKVLKDDVWDYNSPKTPVALQDGNVIIPITRFSNTGEAHYLIYCFKRDDIEITWDVINENNLNTCQKVYPNPTKDKLIIPVENMVSGKLRLIITDIRGDIYVDNSIEADGNLIVVDVKNLVSGVYVYKVITDMANVGGRFVKE